MKKPFITTHANDEGMHCTIQPVFIKWNNISMKTILSCVGDKTRAFIRTILVLSTEFDFVRVFIDMERIKVLSK